jgi:hypothetical protein
MVALLLSLLRESETRSEPNIYLMHNNLLLGCYVWKMFLRGCCKATKSYTRPVNSAFVHSYHRIWPLMPDSNDVVVWLKVIYPLTRNQINTLPFSFSNLVLKMIWQERKTQYSRYIYTSQYILPYIDFHLLSILIFEMVVRLWNLFFSIKFLPV